MPGHRTIRLRKRMKTKHLIVVESALVILLVSILFFDLNGSCNLSSIHLIIIIVSVQILGIVIMFAVYLKMSAKKRSLPDVVKMRKRLLKDR